MRTPPHQNGLGVGVMSPKIIPSDDTEIRKVSTMERNSLSTPRLCVRGGGGVSLCHLQEQVG